MGMLAKQVKIKMMQDIINQLLLIFFVIHIYKHGKFYKLMEKILLLVILFYKLIILQDVFMRELIFFKFY